MVAKLLISSASRILSMDCNTATSKVERMNDGEYYGITGNENKIMITHSAIDSLDPYYREDYSRSVKGYFSVFGNQVLKSKPELSFPHQILFYDGKFYVSNTGKNCLSVYDEQFSFVKDVYPSNRKWDISIEGNKHDHFNSIHIHKGRLYFLAHNHGKESTVWELDLSSLETIRVIKTKAFYAHNVWFESDDLLVCNSRDGGIYSLEEDKIIWKSQEQRVLTRGVAVTDDYVFVGRSEYGTRSSRKVSNGGVYVLDRKNYKEIDRILFKGSGVIYEVRALGCRDFAHNESIMPTSLINNIQNITLSDKFKNQVRIKNRIYASKRNLKLWKKKFKDKKV